MTYSDNQKENIYNLNSTTLGFIQSQTKTFLKRPKKSSHFGQNVWKYKLMSTDTVSFNITMRQMTEMF